MSANWAERLEADWNRERDRRLIAERKRDALADRLAAVEGLADEWDGYGHGVYNVHPEENLPCSVCDLLLRLRATLDAEVGK